MSRYNAGGRGNQVPEIPSTAQLKPAMMTSAAQATPSSAGMFRINVKEQSSGPPSMPEVLVLSDKMLQNFMSPDKYISCVSKQGYTLRDYIRHITAGGFYLNYKYIIIFMGTLQLGVFDAAQNYQQVTDLVEQITARNAQALICISGLVPRPMDFPTSAQMCDEVNKSFWFSVDALCKKNYNVCYMPVFHEFLDMNQNILDPVGNFVEGLFLSTSGIRVLRAVWLRFLGYFPKKSEVSP